VVDEGTGGTEGDKQDSCDGLGLHFGCWSGVGLIGWV
jgi:hypothetical protein